MENCHRKDADALSDLLVCVVLGLDFFAEFKRKERR